MLLYRQDVLDRLGAEPPTTWTEYASLAEQMKSANAVGDFAPAPDQWLGAVEPADWGAAMLVARAACYSGSDTEVSAVWQYRTMQPKLDTPPFVKALTNMRADAVNRTLATPHECYRALLTGRAGMAIAWPTREVKRDEAPDVLPPVRCLPLPGAAETFVENQWVPTTEPRRVAVDAVEGRMISVCREAQRRDAAAACVVWLSGKEWSESVALRSKQTMPCRKSVRAMGPWTGNTLDEEGLAFPFQGPRGGGEPEPSRDARPTSWAAPIPGGAWRGGPE